MSLYNGNSSNFHILKFLAMDEMEIVVQLNDSFYYKDFNGNISQAYMKYLGVDESLKDINTEYTSGLYTGEAGFAGKVLFPDNAGVQNSIDESMRIVINNKLSKIGACETFSHEAYGHGYLYLQNGHDHKGASHGRKMIETNVPLRNLIIKARKETLRNNGL